MRYKLAVSLASVFWILAISVITFANDDQPSSAPSRIAGVDIVESQRSIYMGLPPEHPYANYAVFPEAAPSESVPGLASHMWRYASVVVASDRLPSLEFFKKNVKAVTLRKPVREDVAFIKYCVDNLDVMIVQTGANPGGMIMIFTCPKEWKPSREDARVHDHKILNKDIQCIVQGESIGVRFSKHTLLTLSNSAPPAKGIQADEWFEYLSRQPD